MVVIRDLVIQHFDHGEPQEYSALYETEAKGCLTRATLYSDLYVSETILESGNRRTTHPDRSLTDYFLFRLKINFCRKKLSTYDQPKETFSLVWKFKLFSEGIKS